MESVQYDRLKARYLVFKTFQNTWTELWEAIYISRYFLQKKTAGILPKPLLIVVILNSLASLELNRIYPVPS